MKLKIGFGFDVHPLKQDTDFFLGGIKISHTKGAVGHSDADVLIHAICDALLGAANLRDIGFQFPDSSKEFQGIDSKILLQRVIDLLTEKSFTVSNIDSTICLQSPKISAYIPQMKSALAEILKIEEEDVSIKATTTEKLGFVGREEGVSAYAVVLIQKNQH